MWRTVSKMFNWVTVTRAPVPAGRIHYQLAVQFGRVMSKPFQ